MNSGRCARRARASNRLVKKNGARCDPTINPGATGARGNQAAPLDCIPGPGQGAKNKNVNRVLFIRLGGQPKTNDLEGPRGPETPVVIKNDRYQLCGKRSWPGNGPTEGQSGSSLGDWDQPGVPERSGGVAGFQIGGEQLLPTQLITTAVYEGLTELTFLL